VGDLALMFTELVVVLSRHSATVASMLQTKLWLTIRQIWAQTGRVTLHYKLSLCV